MRCGLVLRALVVYGLTVLRAGPAFGLFSVEELELLICGDPALDFEALEAAAEYENEDFNETHEVVKWFWEVAHSLPEEQKRKLLHFATGSDRAPIGGLKVSAASGCMAQFQSLSPP